MEARKRALSTFYGGPVWTEHRDAANATMIDSDDVLLLKPAWGNAGFDLSGLLRTAPAEAEKPSIENHLPGLVEIQIHHLRPGAEGEFAERFRVEAVRELATNSACLLGAFVSEHAENTFPRLPVRAGENVFVLVTSFEGERAHAGFQAMLTSPARQAPELNPAKPSQMLRLSPTSRSLLGQASAIA
jgi:hypothetical protein